MKYIRKAGILFFWLAVWFAAGRIVENSLVLVGPEEVFIALGRLTFFCVLEDGVVFAGTYCKRIPCGIPCRYASGGSGLSLPVLPGTDLAGDLSDESSSGCVVRDPGADLYGIEESGTLNCIFAGNSDRLLQYVKRLSEHGS